MLTLAVLHLGVPSPPPPFTPGILLTGCESSYGDDISNCPPSDLFTSHYPFCTSCPPACQALAAQRKAGSVDDATGPCIEAYYQDGYCDPACNNVQCGHDAGDCSVTDIKMACVPLQEATMATLSTLPTSPNVTSGSRRKVRGVVDATQTTPIEKLAQAASQAIFGGAVTHAAATKVPLGLQVMLEPFSQTVADGGVLLSTRLTYRTQWSDGRMMDMPCRHILPSLLGQDKATSAADKKLKETKYTKLLWLPDVAIDGKVSEVLEEATFYANETLPWLGSAPGVYSNLFAEACPSCAVYQRKQTITWFMPEEAYQRYYSYPFDEHTIKLTLGVQDADIFECSTALRTHAIGGAPWAPIASNADWDKLLLPPTAAWQLFGKTGGFAMAHPKDNNGNDDTSQCELTFTIRRNYVIFLVKQISIAIVIVVGGLIALFLDPTDHTGDRCALISVSALIIITSYQGDLGIGTLQYLIWYDWFNLAQVALLLVVLGESMYVHILVIREEHEKASTIDHVIQRSILLFYYPALIVGLFFIGFNMIAAGAIVLIVATVSLCIGSYLLVGHTERQKVKGRLTALKAINTGATEPTKEALHTAFTYFDHNGNSEILVADARELLHARLPGLSKDQMTQAMMKARDIAGEQGSLRFSAFNDLLDWAVREFPPGTATGTLIKKVGRAISVTRLTAPVAPGTPGQHYEVTSLESPTSKPKPPE